MNPAPGRVRLDVFYVGDWPFVFARSAFASVVHIAEIFGERGPSLLCRARARPVDQAEAFPLALCGACANRLASRRPEPTPIPMNGPFWWP